MAKRDQDLSGALLVEAKALILRIEAQQEQVERLRLLADRVDEQTGRDRRLLENLEGALGIAAQLRIQDVDGRLRGQRLQEVALEVLKGKVELGAEIHYREWFQMLQDAGHKVGGKDPLATFLSQIARSPEIEPVGRRSGRYRLRLAA